MPTSHFEKFGDWARAGATLQALSTKLVPHIEAQIYEDGDLFLKTIVSHIDAQDLGWTPLSPKTVELKGGDTTIYVETGWLRNNLEVRRIRAGKGDVTIFVGASAWKRHPSGMQFSELMIWLEYGTDKLVPRPLIRPSWEEIEPIIKGNWGNLINDFVRGGVKGG